MAEESKLQDLYEKQACTPKPLATNGFNSKALLPYGLKIEHMRSAMQGFLEFLGFINTQLRTRDLPRLESFLMPANFSSIVGEFISVTIPKYCPTLAKNTYHNGHPDLLPKGMYPNDSMLHAPEGIEVKGSRYTSGWQGHNPEQVFLIVFVFESSRPSDEAKSITPVPFRFLKVVGAKLKRGDWQFAGRSEQSRRTITATVTGKGCVKMDRNWIYRDMD